MALPTLNQYSPGGPSNLFIPGYSDEAQARIIVEYVRNPKEFTLNKYITITPVSKIVGFYPKIYASDAIRVLTTDGSDMLWPDNTPSGAATAHVQGSRLTNIQYNLRRYKQEANVGDITQEQAEFDYILIEQNRLASIMMTFRTVNVLTAALTTANYPSSHVGTATALGGGFWQNGTINQPNIQQTLSAVRSQILLDTNNSVKIKDLNLIISPTPASSMAQSQEIRAYMAQQNRAIEVLRGEEPDADNWLLPNPLYAFNVVIEACPVVLGSPPSDNPYAPNIAGDGTAAFAMNTDTALIAARPGSLVGKSGQINYSTLHILELKNHAFKVYQEHLGQRDQITYLRVEDFFVSLVIAPESGYIVNNITS